MEDEQKRQERKVVVYWELFVIKQKDASLGRTKSKLQIYAAWPPQQSVIETKHLNNTWIQMFMLSRESYLVPIVYSCYSNSWVS